MLLAPTFNRPTIGGGYLAPSNGLKVIALGHRKLAGSIFNRRQQREIESTENTVE